VSFNLTLPRVTKATLGGAERTVSTSDGMVTAIELPPEPAELTLIPDSQAVTVGASAALTAIVTDTSGNPVVDGTSVSFATISPPGIGDLVTPVATTGGVAVSTLSGITTPVTVTVRARATGVFPSVQDTAIVVFRPGNPASLELTPESKEVAVGGAAALSAAVGDQFGNPVADGTSVSFSTVPAGIGDLTTPVATAGGVAVSTLSGVDTPMTVTVRARATGVFPFVQDLATVIFVEPGVDHFAFDQIGFLQTACTPFTVTITAEDAMGTVVSTFTGTVTLSDSSGTIDPTVSGSFMAGVWGGPVHICGAGWTQITATDGEGKTGQSNLFRVDPGATADVALEAELSSVVVGTSTTLAATVSDGCGNPVADGTQVVFETDLGKVRTTVLTPTTVGGVATVELYSEQAGTATVSATADSISDSTAVVFTPDEPFTLTLEADPMTLPRGEISDLTASVVDQYGNDVADGTVVDFASTLGAISDVMPTSGGEATAKLGSDEVGTATVTATADGVSDSTDVLFVLGEATQWHVVDISSPQYVNWPFTIVVHALDEHGYTTDFSGTATLADTTGTIAPTSVSVVDGAGATYVTISAPGADVTVTASDDGLDSGTSNSFDVMWRSKLFLPMMARNAS
jgi:hypothetical protein